MIQGKAPLAQHPDKPPDRYLTVGEYYFSAIPCLLKTVLGSCVTLTMFDKITSTGAMCHGLLPDCKHYDNCDKDYAVCFRFVECSIWAMLDKFESIGVPRNRLEVKLFGGASILKKRQAAADVFQVGQRNVQAAIKVIKEARLNLVAYDFGGTESRRISFQTDTGKVLLKRSGLDKETEI